LGQSLRTAGSASRQTGSRPSGRLHTRIQPGQICGKGILGKVNAFRLARFSTSLLNLA